MFLLSIRLVLSRALRRVPPYIVRAPRSPNTEHWFLWGLRFGRRRTSPKFIYYTPNRMFNLTLRKVSSEFVHKQKTCSGCSLLSRSNWKWILIMVLCFYVYFQLRFYFLDLHNKLLLVYLLYDGDEQCSSSWYVFVLYRNAFIFILLYLYFCRIHISDYLMKCL